MFKSWLLLVNLWFIKTLNSWCCSISLTDDCQHHSCPVQQSIAAASFQVDWHPVVLLRTHKQTWDKKSLLPARVQRHTHTRHLNQQLVLEKGFHYIHSAVAGCRSKIPAATLSNLFLLYWIIFSAVYTPPPPPHIVLPHSSTFIREELARQPIRATRVVISRLSIGWRNHRFSVSQVTLHHHLMLLAMHRSWLPAVSPTPHSQEERLTVQQQSFKPLNTSTNYSLLFHVPGQFLTIIIWMSFCCWIFPVSQRHNALLFSIRIWSYLKRKYFTFT